MANGCQGPYLYGVGGDGFPSPCCSCKCCPPPCCDSVTVNYDCVRHYYLLCGSLPICCDAGTILCCAPSVTTTVGVTLTKGPEPDGVCCIEFLGGGTSFRAVGNGTVIATVDPSSNTCGTYTATVNGTTTATVVDGATLTVSLTNDGGTCCECTQTFATNPCGLTMRMATLKKNNKIIINRHIVTQKLYNERLKRGVRVK